MSFIQEFKEFAMKGNVIDMAWRPDGRRWGYDASPSSMRLFIRA